VIPKIEKLSMNFVKSCRKIVAIGRNYAEHAKELGDVVPKEPMFFLKPSSSFIQEPSKVEIPKGINCHHELELGVVIGKTGKNISHKDAFNHVVGYCLALDMTARCIQNQAKKEGSPWSKAKGFDTFTPVGNFIEKSKILDPSQLRLKLMVGNRVAQNGKTSDMIFSIPTLIEYVSKIMTLEQGDVILTGTPSGVSQVLPGEKMIGELSSKDGIITKIEFTATERKYNE
jgi:acylpyruvate hydrolase